MARINGVYKAGDHPNKTDEPTKSDLNELFGYLFPQSPSSEIDRKHGGFAIVAVNPRLALLLVQLNNYIVSQMPWTSQRRGLRELAVQTLNLHFKCEYSFRSHIEPSLANGISVELLAALPYWRTTELFDDEQKLVIEYTLAVITGDVPDELFSRVVKQYGEKETVECTTGIAWWSLWAMIINATRP